MLTGVTTAEQAANADTGARPTAVARDAAGLEAELERLATSPSAAEG
jgi:hypothetical protein